MIRITELLINGIDYSEFATIPLQEQNALDESLDLGYIEFKCLDFEQPFTPFSDVVLKVADDYGNNKEFYYFVESDETTEIIANKKYNHNVLLIEQTKWIERFFVEKSVTRPLIRNYLSGAVMVYPSDVNGITPERNENFVSPIKNLSNVFVPSVKEIYNQTSDYGRTGGFKIYKKNKITSNEQVEIYSTTDTSESYLLQTEPNTEYAVKYEYIYSYGPGTSDANRATFEFITMEEMPNKTIKNLKDVMNLLLETCETIRESETPRFRLAKIEEYPVEIQEQISKIYNMTSPDFYFSKMSLFEAFKTIGDYAHFLPRMKNKTIYLDLLGGEQIADIVEDYYSAILTQSTNDFCTKFDSQVNNLVNLDSDNQGSVTTPFNGGYRTFRAEYGEVVINDQNIIIATESPIEKIISLEIGYLRDGTLVGDITPYVYEKAEYEALSSYSDQFPYSKMYALQFTQGNANITGLSFERKNVVSQAFENIAIKNIIFRKTNKDVNWWNNLWDTEDVFKLQYRLTYIPSTSTRVVQSKALKDNITKSVSIAYNQSASKVSSNAYGENLKGQLLKLGNVEKRKMFVFPSLDLIPVCGQKYDEDYYISMVKCEYYPNFIKCELGLSKDYNNKSAYIEINSEIRFYEISEKTAYDIYRVYDDYCEIGFESQTDNKSLITNNGIDKFSKAFQQDYQDTQITMVKANGIDEYGDARAFDLPVISLGIGNSILLEYHYVDNFSAGISASYEQGRDGLFNKVQQLERYTDIYGEIEYLDLKYGKNMSLPYNQDMAVDVGDNLPNASVEMDTYLDTDGDRIRLLKDNREIIHFTYQMHFVANKKSLIIGSGLASYSTFVTSEKHNFKLYVLGKKLNKFENVIDLTNATECGSISIEYFYDNKSFKIKDFIAPENGKAWAIAQNGQLILGENIDINKDENVSMPYFVFKRKIVED